jgi:hypothetical protein
MTSSNVVLNIQIAVPCVCLLNSWHNFVWNLPLACPRGIYSDFCGFFFCRLWISKETDAMQRPEKNLSTMLVFPYKKRESRTNFPDWIPCPCLFFWNEAKDLPF